MSASIYQLGHKKFSQIIFEWQAADRASLLALFIVMEVGLHWLWCLSVWLRRDTLSAYINMNFLYPTWVVITLVGLFFWWMVGHLSHIKNDDQQLNESQLLLISTYSVYIAIVILVMGHSSLVSGVSLVGGAMLGMMLVRRTYIWKAFLLQVALILLVTLIPYLGVSIPSLRHLSMSSIFTDGYSYVTYGEMMTTENAMATSILNNGHLSWERVDDLRRSSAFFWRSTHIYLALPKAIFMVYVFRILLFILDDSKKEILKHANEDELTQMMNRRYGLMQMQQTLMATTDAQDYSVILLDLDLFKHINDSYGHEVGDQVLKEVAHLITNSLEDKVLISRYGGEEFLIVLPYTPHELAIRVAEQLRQKIAQHVIKVDNMLSFQVTASLGLYTINYHELEKIKLECAPTSLQVSTPKPTKLQLLKSRGNTQPIKLSIDTQSAQISSDVCQRLISVADKALYEAKDQGRNKVVSANDLLAEGAIALPRYGT